MTTKWNYGVKENGQNKKRYPNYICSNIPRGLCRGGTMSHAKVARAFADYLARIEDFTELEHMDLPKNAVTDHRAEIANIRTETARAETKNEEIMDLFVSNAIDFNHYQRMTQRNNQRRAELQARLDQLQRADSDPGHIYTAADIAVNIRENWMALADEQRLQFVQKFIDKIMVHSESTDSHKRRTVVVDEVTFNDF